MLKKLFCVMAAVMMVLPLMGQTSEYANIRESGDDVAISFGGFEFVFGKNETIARRKSNNIKVSSGLLNHIRYGMNALVEYDNFPELNTWKSSHFSMDIYSVKFFLGQSRLVSLSTGLQYVLNDYTFRQDVSVEDIGSYVLSYPLGQHYKKSKLSTHYIGVPVYLGFNITRDLELSLYGYYNLLVDSFTKIKKPVYKEHFSAVSKYQLGYGLSMCVDDFGIFVQYNRNPIFANGISPKLHSYTVGVVMSF